MLTKEQLEQMENWGFDDLIEFVGREYSYHDIITYKDRNTNEWVNKSTVEFIADINKCAAFINARFGFKKNIAICATNSYIYICAFFGIVISGNVAVLLDATMKDRQLADFLKMTESVACFSDKTASEKLEESNIVSYQYNIWDLYFQPSNIVETSHKNSKDINAPAVIMATSGVTSNPKFVMLSQKNLIHAALNGVYALPIQSGFRTLSVLPLHHAFETCCGLLYPLICGGRIVQNDGLEKIKTNLTLHKPDFIVVVPSIATSLNMLYRVETAAGMESCISSLKYIICGGAPISPIVIDELSRAGIYVLQGYGLTETGASVAMNIVDDFTIDTVGRPMKFSKVKIVNDEVYVSSPAVMIGYYNNPTGTAEVLADGWLKTGDVGLLDEYGHLKILGRFKNIIVLSTGEKIYPEELEEKLNAYGSLDYCKIYERQGKVCVDIFSSALSVDQIENIIADFNDKVMKHQRIAEINCLHDKPQTTALGKPLRR